MGVLLNPAKAPATPYLTVADTVSGHALKELRIDPIPLQQRYAEHMNACFCYYDEKFELQ
jgi:hypothetical protein